MPSSYRLSRAFAARLLGGALVLAGLLVVVLVVLAVVLALPVVVPLLVLAVLALVVLALAAVVLRRPVVVVFDDLGYRVRLVRGAGVRQGEWKQVEDVATATVSGARCVVLRLKDGRTTTVPVDALGARTEDFVDDLRAHLDRGHGYRPVPGRA